MWGAVIGDAFFLSLSELWTWLSMTTLKYVPWSPSAVCHFLTSLQSPVDSYLFTWIEKRVRRDASLFACGGETRSDTNYQLSLFSCMHREWTLPSLPYLSPKTLLYMHAQINIHSCTDRLGLCHQAWGSQKERRAGLLNGGRSHWIDNVKTKNGDVKVSE